MKMINPDLSFQSKILQSFFKKLDEHIFNQEEYIKDLENEIRKNQNEIVRLQNKISATTQQNITRIFSSLFPDTTIVEDASTAMILRNIHDMNDLKEVKEYIEQIFSQSKENIKKTKS